MKYAEELKLGRFLAAATRREILKHYHRDLRVEYKADNSPVTIADKNAEELLRTYFEKETPDYGITGEEFGKKAGTSGREWVVDPIDGTKAFIHGVPLFGTLIALMDEGRPVLGLMDFPALDILVHAVKGESACVNDQACRVSTTETIEEAFLVDGSAKRVAAEGYGEAWNALIRKARLHRGWGDCYGYFLVATGKADVMFDPVVNAWDVAAVAIVLREAGGKFTDVKGGESVQGGSGLGSNGKLHGDVLASLNRSAA